jgi:hypothetical protein
MSKLITVVVLLTAAAFATAARAAPQNNPAPQQAVTTSNTASDNNATSNHASPIKPGDRGCLRDTGSLIPAKKGECLPVTGRSYTQKDIQATGQTNLGPALQQLDPAITVRGNGEKRERHCFSLTPLHLLLVLHRKRDALACDVNKMIDVALAHDVWRHEINHVA